MRRRFRTVAAVAVVSLVALGSTACDLTDNDADPGAAASLSGETLELSKVDDAVQDYCALRAGNPEASAVPTALIRTQFVLAWTQAIAVQRLADDYAVTLPPEKVDRAVVEAAWGELGTIDDDNYDTFEWLTWIQQYLADPVTVLGASAISVEGGPQPTQQDATNRGVALITDWLADHAPKVNPVFGTFDADEGVFAGDTLSVPVSKPAKGTDDTAKLTAEEIAALPAAQRCGPAGAAADPAPGV